MTTSSVEPTCCAEHRFAWDRRSKAKRFFHVAYCHVDMLAEAIPSLLEGEWYVAIAFHDLGTCEEIFFLV